MQVRIFGTLRQFAGTKALHVDVEPGDTVQKVLVKITAGRPTLRAKLLADDGKLQSSINVLVNGRSITFLDGPNTVLHEGDQFALFPTVGGG